MFTLFSPFLLSQMCNADTIMLKSVGFLKVQLLKHHVTNSMEGNPVEGSPLFFHSAARSSLTRQKLRSRKKLFVERWWAVVLFFFCHRNIVHIANPQVQTALKESFTPTMCFFLLINHALNLEFNSITNCFCIDLHWFRMGTCVDVGPHPVSCLLNPRSAFFNLFFSNLWNLFFFFFFFLKQTFARSNLCF